MTLWKSIRASLELTSDTQHKDMRTKDTLTKQHWNILTLTQDQEPTIIWDMTIYY